MQPQREKADQRNREEVAYCSPPVTRAPTAHLLDKPSQRPRPRLGVPGEALWSKAEVSGGREGYLGDKMNDPHKLSENDWESYCRYCSFERSSCCVAQSGLKFLAAIPPLPPKPQDCRHVPLKDSVFQNKPDKQTASL